ncbi:MAG: YkvA family protein [Candidatus Rokuibacteriota bacterium]
MLEGWTRRARDLKREVYALYFACRDPRVPWYGKVFAAGIVGYAFSPIDLIPDFIPVLGYLDDLVLIPLGIMAIRAMIPHVVMAECRERAVRLESKPRSWVAAVVIVVIWLGLAAAAVYWLASWVDWSHSARTSRAGRHPLPT